MFSFSDEQIQRIISQDERAFGEFYEQTVDVFYRYLSWRYFLSWSDIDDILSDYYVKCRKWLGSFNPKYKFESYIRTILKNHVKDFFKKKKMVTLWEDDSMDNYLFDNSETEMLDIIQTQFDSKEIFSAMEQLDEKSYEIVFLRYVEQLDYDEISEFVEMSQDAIRQRLSRALKKIRSLIDIKNK